MTTNNVKTANDMPFGKLCNSTIQFRSRFVDRFGLKTNSELRKVLLSTFVKFNSLPFGQAFNILFSLLYGEAEDKKKALNSLGLGAEGDNVTSTAEQVSALAYELRYQYSLYHTEFLKVKENSRYQKELEALKKRLSNDPLLYYRAATACQRVIKDYPYQVESILTMLNKNAFHGLKDMGHNHKSASLLKDYAKEIATLLEAMYNAYKEEQDTIAKEQEKANAGATPLAGLAQKLKENGIVLPDECEPISDETPVSTEPPISAEPYIASEETQRIIEYEGTFNSYFKADKSLKLAWLKELRSFGFDLNKVIDNEDSIRELLGVIEELVYEPRDWYLNAQNNFDLSVISLAIQLDIDKSVIIQNLDTFIQYMDGQLVALQKLFSLGFDLNKIVSNLGNLEALVEDYNALERARKNLEKSKVDFGEVCRKFEMGMK